jgi:hypothetical protein
MDDIDTIGKMIAKAVARVSRRETRREENRRYRQLEKEAKSLLLELLNDSGLTRAVMDFLDAKEKAQEKEIRGLDDKDHANWEDDDPRWDAVNALWEAIQAKYDTAQNFLELELNEHFGEFNPPSLDELLEASKP